MATTLLNQATAFGKVRTTNATDTSFAARVPTVTQPTGAGVIAVGQGGVAADKLMLVPFGADAADETFAMRALGWKIIGTVWVPVELLVAACTLSTMTGVAGGALAETDYLVDTITVSIPAGTPPTNTEVVSPADNMPAHVVIGTHGFALVEVQFDLTGAASANALWAVN